MSALAPGWWMVPLALWLVVLLVLLVRVGYDRESGVLDRLNSPARFSGSGGMIS